MRKLILQFDGNASTRNHWSAKRALSRFWWTSDLVQANGLAFIIVPDEGVDMGTQLNDSVEGDPGRRLVCQDGEPNQDAVHASLNHDSAFRIGNLSGNVHRSRNALNADTIREMHATFRRGGRKAIETAMRNQPAVRFS